MGFIFRKASLKFLPKTRELVSPYQDWLLRISLLLFC